jgi:hypothetical protein
MLRPGRQRAEQRLQRLAAVDFKEKIREQNAAKQMEGWAKAVTRSNAKASWIGTLYVTTYSIPLEEKFSDRSRCIWMRRPTLRRIALDQSRRVPEFVLLVIEETRGRGCYWLLGVGAGDGVPLGVAVIACERILKASPS